MAQRPAHKQGHWRRKNAPRDDGRQPGSLGLGPRRAVRIIVLPLAVSAVLASSYAVAPGVATAPALEAPLASAAIQPPMADRALIADQQSLTAPVAGVAAPAATQLSHGQIGLAREYQASVDRIPAAALAAYQRAELIMDMAAPRCRLDWTVLAGVAEVESDHGQAGPNRVTDKGVSRPGVFGKPLDGKHGRERMSDTDAGSLDDNRRWDAPAGPMGLLPSTWSVVAVDSDGDGKRNLQDVDDAALGVAVFVCHGGADLSVRAKLRAALRSLNPTPGYARLVMSLARSYSEDAASATPLPSTVVALPELPLGPFRYDTGDSGANDPKGRNGAQTGNQNAGAAESSPADQKQANSVTPPPSSSGSEPQAPESPPAPADPPATEPEAPESPPAPADPPATEPEAPESPPAPADPPATEPEAPESPPAPADPPAPTDPPESQTPTQEDCDPATEETPVPEGCESLPAETTGEDTSGTQ